MPDLINDIGPANFYIAWVLVGVSLPILIACAITAFRRQK